MHNQILLYLNVTTDVTIFFGTPDISVHWLKLIVHPIILQFNSVLKIVYTNAVSFALIPETLISIPIRVITDSYSLQQIFYSLSLLNRKIKTKFYVSYWSTPLEFWYDFVNRWSPFWIQNQHIINYVSYVLRVFSIYRSPCTWINFWVGW